MYYLIFTKIVQSRYYFQDTDEELRVKVFSKRWKQDSNPGLCGFEAAGVSINKAAWMTRSKLLTRARKIFRSLDSTYTFSLMYHPLIKLW